MTYFDILILHIQTTWITGSVKGDSEASGHPNSEIKSLVGRRRLKPSPKEKNTHTKLVCGIWGTNRNIGLGALPFKIERISPKRFIE